MLIIEEICDVEDTYDVTNPTNHNFFANDILVHNSEIILRPYQFCNLSEVIVRSDDTEASIKQKIKIATILGTFQSTLTSFPYLRKIWTKNTEEERLLGVSLTGIYDSPLTSSLDETIMKKRLEEFKQVAIDVNKEWADKLGINQSAAITAVKPSGCTTLDTRVKTSSGVMNMADIFSKFTDVNIFEQNPGTWLSLKEELFVYDENNNLQEVTKLYVNGLAEVYEIEDDRGNCFKFTGNHKLKTVNGWKRVDELTITDEIIQF